MTEPDLSVTDWVVLGVVGEGTTHGFAVARQLAVDGPLGRVWTVHRPIVYRSLDHLEQVGLIERTAAVPGAGPRKTPVRITRAGRRRLHRWLDRPVPHVRDVRSQLLLKLALLDRAGRDHAVLVREQRAVVDAVVARLRVATRAADGFDAVVLRWRIESARAVLRFLDALERG